jgi:Uma2 family endonuclease
MITQDDLVSLCTEPDGTFVSNASLHDKRVRLVARDERYLEIEGTPDMVLEVVSDSSVRKDTRTLKALYWHAGVAEYWLIDGRGATIRFDILRHTPDGYVPTRKSGGWVRSGVFGKSFRLTAGSDEFGHPEYTGRPQVIPGTGTRVCASWPRRSASPSAR